MYMFDGRITLKDKEMLDTYLNGYDYRTSGLSFSAMYMWKEANQFSWRQFGDYLCLAGVSHLELEEGIILPFMFMPLTRTGSYDPAALRQTLYEARDFFEEKGFPFSLRLVPLHMLDILREACPGELKFIDDRPNYDYVYRTQDLIELRGRAYHGKKNHLNYFQRTYDYEYQTLTSAMAGEAMEFLDEFNARKDVPEHEMEMLKMEQEAMRDVLDNLETVGYDAGAIRINGRIEALAIGGTLNRNTVTEHVEKANVNYRGLYQAINYEFCRHVAHWAKYINREEDMGIPNLRKAKLSYHPCKLLEKYIVTFRESGA
ncbi:MAG: DUF2156 domain-containing protein [Anaerovoracaceae bacterium]|jgi:hypothetical protein